MPTIALSFRVGWSCPMTTHLDDAIAGRGADLPDGGQLEVFETWRPRTPQPYRRRRRPLQPRAGRLRGRVRQGSRRQCATLEVPDSRT
jgi:hypothetical protein